MIKRAVHFLADKQGAILKALLSLVVILFVAILIALYFVARKDDPVILDEAGKPVNA